MVQKKMESEIRKADKAEAVGAHFIDNGDGTVTDRQLKVIWVKDPSLIAGLQETMTFDAAKAACEKLQYAGYNSGWRMPTVEELRSIIDYTRHDPAWDINVFGGKYDDWYWTSTTCAWNSGAAWCVGSSLGFVSNSYRGSNGFVRPVRSSQ